MRILTITLSLLFSIGLYAQKYNLKGSVYDEKVTPLLYATVALLNPADSTLSYFGVTNDNGQFNIKDIAPGNYLLQTAYVGYQSYFKSIMISANSKEDFGDIIMKPVAINLGETEIIGERVPILINKDTIEYNAAAFKTKPDAAVEDLLKKLPGVEVDRAGNIKAQGEQIKKVMVDGKEFFGNDPKIATKNLPADAINKVQVYDKKSDEAELTGIDDGSREKTINLLLKDNKKSAWLGDVQAGAGTQEHYMASAKAYRFTKKNQIAILGMINNINQFGFSFQDYIDFNGGIGSLMGGGGDFRITINDDNAFPINFGQPVNGLITSGAAGINYSYDKKKDNHFNISYLGNGANKNLLETANSKYFLDDGSFTQNETLQTNNESRAHRLNFGWRNKYDTLTNLIINGDLSLTNGNSNRNGYLESLSSDSLLNNQNSIGLSNSNGLSGNGRVSWLKTSNTNWKLIKVAGDISFNTNLKKNQWENLTKYFGTNDVFFTQQFQNNQKDLIKSSFKTSVTRKIGYAQYLEPGISIGGFKENLNREQGILPGNEVVIDSLSPDFVNTYIWVKPSIKYKFATKKSQFTFNAQLEKGLQKNGILTQKYVEQDIFYFTPSVSWDYEYRRSHRIQTNYISNVNLANAEQLLPVTDSNDPLQLYKGNQNLKPEYEHSLRLNWIVFDEFSFSSIFAGISGFYTKDKINWSRTTLDNLGQSLTLINVPEDYRLEGNIDYSTPIRKLGISVQAGFTESWNRGFSIVDNINNINTNLKHEFNLSVDNRKKDKIDIRVGGSISYNDAKYSIQKNLNKHYLNYTYFSEINYTPTDKWHLSLSADVTQYNSIGFDKAVNIPLLKASVSRYFLKGNRGVLSLEVFDILNKNTGIERISELNYLRQKQSNIIGRYAMLSFKYKLNKFGNNQGQGGVDIQIKRR